MSSNIGDMFPFVLTKDGRRIPEIVQYEEFRKLGHKEKQVFIKKFPGPYSCAQCSGRIELCVGEKNIPHFRHSSKTTNCGGTSPFHKACVVAVVANGYFMTGTKRIRFDAVHAIRKPHSSSKFPDISVRTSEWKSIALEIDFATHTQADFPTHHETYRLDVNKARLRLERRFGKNFKVDDTGVPRAIAVEMANSDFGNITGKWHSKQMFLKIKETPIPTKNLWPARAPTFADHMRALIVKAKSAFSSKDTQSCPVEEERRKKRRPRGPSDSQMPLMDNTQ